MDNNKRTTLNRAFAVLLAIASILALVAGGMDISKVSTAKTYWEQIRSDGLEQMQMLEDGINQLKANEQVYTDGVTEYEEGLVAYREGMQTYYDGILAYHAGKNTYEEGLEEYEQGKKDYAAGEAKVAAGEAQVAEGQAAYDSGAAQIADGYAKLAAAKEELAAGEAELAAGKQTLADNKQAYEEGKAKLAAVEPIYNACMGVQGEIDTAQANYDQAVANGDTEAAAEYQAEIIALQAAMSAELGGYSMGGIISEYQAGQAQIAAYEAGEAEVAAGEAKIADAKQQIADAEALLAEKDQELAAGGEELDAGKAQLAQGKADLADGAAQLKDAEKQLADGEQSLTDAEKELAEGKAKLADAKTQLKDGKAQLAQYEDGESQVAAGIETARATDTYYDLDGNPTAETINSRLGADYEYYQEDANGEVLLLNGVPALDLDECLETVTAGRAFIDDVTYNYVTPELTWRAVADVIAIVAAIAGLAAAVLFFLKGNLTAGIASAAAAVLGFVAAIMLGVQMTKGYSFSVLSGITSSPLGYIGAAAIGVTAAVLAVSYFAGSKFQPAVAGAAPAAETAAEAPIAEAAAAEAPVAAAAAAQAASETAPAAPVETARQKEIRELKDRLAQLEAEENEI